MSNPARHLLSTAEAAKILHVTTRSVQRWAGEGLIPAMKMSGRTGAYVFDPDVIETARREGIVRDGVVVVQGVVRDRVA